MTKIEVGENSDGQDYTFIIKQKGKTTAENLTSYTAVTMTIVSKDLLTKHGTITLDFGTKANGEIVYTSDVADPYPAIPSGKKSINLFGKITITGTGLKEITDIIEIEYGRDFAGI